MNINECLVMQLGEECVEAAQRVSKLLRFGRDEIEPGQSLTNVERLRDELHDIHGMIMILKERGLIEYDPTPHTDAMKKAKVERFLAYAISIGAVTEA